MVPHNLLLASCVVFIFKGGIFILKENEVIKEIKRELFELKVALKMTSKEDVLKIEQINARIEYLKKALARELTTIAYETETENAIDRRTTALEEKDKVLESRRNIRNKLIEDTMVNHPGVLEENKGRKR
ncbi:MAG TPA: hypothetical protein DHU33_01215 [Firmicutes bacterium]|nr:hypothetical protein [Bacillota bacterium]